MQEIQMASLKQVKCKRRAAYNLLIFFSAFSNLTLEQMMMLSPHFLAQKVIKCNYEMVLKVYAK